MTFIALKQNCGGIFGWRQSDGHVTNLIKKFSDALFTKLEWFCLNKPEMGMKSLSFLASLASVGIRELNFMGTL